MAAPTKMVAALYLLSLQASQELSMVVTPSFLLQPVALVKHVRNCPQWQQFSSPQQPHTNGTSAKTSCICEALPTLTHVPHAREKGEKKKVSNLSAEKPHDSNVAQPAKGVWEELDFFYKQGCVIAEDSCLLS